LNYTGLTLKAYNTLLGSYGIRGTASYIRSISKGDTLGFDLYTCAALACFFKLPVGMIFLMNIQEKGIDLATYGVFKNCYIKKVPKLTKEDRAMWETYKQSVIRKTITRAANKRAQHPSRLLDVRALLNRTTGERSQKNVF